MNTISYFKIVSLSSVFHVKFLKSGTVSFLFQNDATVSRVTHVLVRLKRTILPRGLLRLQTNPK